VKQLFLSRLGAFIAGCSDRRPEKIERDSGFRVPNAMSSK